MESDRVRRLAAAVDAAHQRLDEYEQRAREPIAIIGMGCRMPGGADDPDALWSLLSTGGDAVTAIPPERLTLARALGDDGFDDPAMADTYGAFVDGIEGFEPAFFGLSEREATRLDPQHRMLLEVSWQTLENAALDPMDLRGSRTGLYVGICFEDFGRRRGDAIDVASSVGSSRSIGVGRVAYNLDLHGPVMQLDTTCSSSLLAVHLAAHALRRGECDLALAGGVNALLTHEVFLAFQQMGALSRSGRCRTFDANADGYVRGEGCAMVALKTLSKARADGDHVWAVIEGSAVNHDGRSNGLTAPNGSAQEGVIRDALENAGCAAADIGYLELHGTGTPLGDPIEASAAMRVLGEGRPAGRTLYAGSIKTNVGHLEGGAGVAGLMKAALAIHHGRIPPSRHFQTPNERIAWDKTALEVPTAPVDWPAGTRLAGVSSFGMSGTNVHIVLGPAPAGTPAATAAAPAKANGGHDLVVSARTDASLRRLAGRYAETLDRKDGPALADVCFTINTTRHRFEHAVTFHATDAAEMAAALRAFAAGGTPAACTPGADAAAPVAGRRVPLPPYAFERARYWPDLKPQSRGDAAAPPVVIVPNGTTTAQPPAKSGAAATASAAAIEYDVPALRALLLDAIAAATDAPADQIDDATPLVQLGIDSLAGADVLITMERALGRALPDHLVQPTATIMDLAKLLAAGPEAVAPSEPTL